MNLPPEVERHAADFSHPLVFATISGAHLYGFPSPDSDFDLRGCHLTPAGDLLGLRDPELTVEFLGPDGEVEMDLVSHDLAKFARLLLKPNGYVLEQLTSPIVVRTSPLHDELLRLVPELVTKRHAHHYLGFAAGQWKLLAKEPKVKPLLYLYRVLLTGIHLMRTGRIEASLPALVAEHPLVDVADLLDRKLSGAERQPLDEGELEAHEQTYHGLVELLERARDDSHLPEEHDLFDRVDRLVREARLASL